MECRIDDRGRGVWSVELMIGGVWSVELIIRGVYGV